MLDEILRVVLSLVEYTASKLPIWGISWKVTHTRKWHAYAGKRAASVREDTRVRGTQMKNLLASFL